MHGKYVISGASAAKQLYDNTSTQIQGQNILARQQAICMAESTTTTTDPW
jgi:hypothetical protein